MLQLRRGDGDQAGTAELDFVAFSRAAVSLIMRTGRRVAALPARPALQRGLKLPDRRVARPADSIQRQARLGLAAIAFYRFGVGPPRSAPRRLLFLGTRQPKPRAYCSCAN